ncbi:hypothetical protein SBY92_001044 [Candida maltosa Xu316]|uniref:Uncharacterized protein n=1 Tax=Candida maltosa (strain Xu316) TaxID=1245528 RepID=M3JRE3_CANMX|nr:hypothetical protein G210_4471 [Candida maltosa Xu316]
MIANSTRISNRMFRSQRLIVLTILAGFLVLLGITSISGHHHAMIESVKDMSTKAGNSISGMYNWGPEEEELNEQAQAEVDKLKELADESQEEKLAQAEEKLEEEQIEAAEEAETKEQAAEEAEKLNELAEGGSDEKAPAEEPVAAKAAPKAKAAAKAKAAPAIEEPVEEEPAEEVKEDNTEPVAQS